MKDYMKNITEYVCKLRFEDIPSDVVMRAKLVVIDTIAAIAAGAQEEEIKKLSNFLNVTDGKGVSSVIGSGFKTEALKAALLNGASGTFLEIDEGNQFGRGHPAVQMLPAVIAVAEEKKLSGKDLITALVVGYEIGTRIGIASKLRMSMHPHGVWGTVAAAVGLGKLLDYDQAAMKELISVSASMTTATNRQTMLDGGTVRNIYSGMSSHNGLLAHYMIQSGFTGEKDGLNTVFSSVVSEEFNQEAMIEDLGNYFEIGRNYFKRYACCRYNHSALDATMEITGSLPDGRLDPDAIEKIDVWTYSLAAQLCGQEPDNMLAAKFSIPFAIATYLIHGNAGVSSFRMSAVQNPIIRDLSKKVTIFEDPKLTAMMPRKRPSRVLITLKNGDKLESEAFINKGDTEDPYTQEELKEKYHELVDPVFGDATAENIYEKLIDLDKAKDISEIIKQMIPINVEVQNLS